MSVTVHESQIMPAYAANSNDLASFDFSQAIPPRSTRTSSDRSPIARENGDALSNGAAAKMNSKLSNGPPVMQSVPNGRTAKPSSPDKRSFQEERLAKSSESRGSSNDLGLRDDGQFASVYTATSETKDRLGTTQVKLGLVNPVEGTKEARKDFMPPLDTSSQPQPNDASANLLVPSQTHRVSSPPAFNHNTTSPSQPIQRLQHRHTLEVPKPSPSRPRDSQNNTDDVITASGRFSPTTDRRRRASMSLVRRNTRSVNSDMHLDEVPQDEDAARWAEHIRQKRASKRKRKEDEDEDRVVVGTKVDQNHVNWVTAYNMLTGIRFTVSRTNAKMDRELTDADFDAKHKFSFDMYVPSGFPYVVKNLVELNFGTGNELTPSAKYDFKFKDYAPWVFRHLRSTFKLDPADYLVSLTSKYILSELGSPGKSGSFFYFSRDYKYIIKTIHHAEHKFLRKILKDYYNHVQENPNTLLSQFYGLHRVKIPYGRKIHFVVMNNLFPPHRDIHTTFDLKGSTIGRDFKEEDLAANPRATMKDLNWLRRSLHLEFGPTKKEMFIQQMQKDVKLLQRLHIMDYSLLIGIHDLEKGNEENLRDKTLQVFQPGGEEAPDPRPNMLMRTPSKLESARKARELRQMVKTQKPVPMEQTLNKMPDELQDPKPEFYFYSDDGGFRATHEDNTPGEEIYYLGIIDCLTHYSIIKRMEHFFKGLANTESQISAIPPERYGDRFVKFISGVTKTKEAADREKREEAISTDAVDESLTTSFNRSSTDRVMQRAEHQAEKSRQRGRSEENVPHRELRVVRSPSAERGEIGTSLPVVEEAGESSSVGGRSNRSTLGEVKSARVNGDLLNPAATAGPPPTGPPPPPPTTTNTNTNTNPSLKEAYLGLPERTSSLRSRSPSNDRDQSTHHRPPPTPPKDIGAADAENNHSNSNSSEEQRPPTPPKDDAYLIRHAGAAAVGPPTPPKEKRGRSPARNKELPRTPLDISVN